MVVVLVGAVGAVVVMVISLSISLRDNYIVFMLGLAAEAASAAVRRREQYPRAVSVDLVLISDHILSEEVAVEHQELLIQEMAAAAEVRATVTVAAVLVAAAVLVLVAAAVLVAVARAAARDRLVRAATAGVE